MKNKKNMLRKNLSILIAVLMLLLITSPSALASTPGIKFGLHFDEKGNVIRPDEVFLGRGLHDEKAGFKDQAMKNFKESASFGNAYAKYFMGLLYLQKNDYLNGHAWLSLLDSEFKGADKVNNLLPRIKANLDESQMKLADKKLSELKETYGEYAALMKREKWRKSHKYTGSHIKGHVPNNLRIEVGNGMSVTGHNIRKQIETFVYEYEYQFRLGEVNLKETEYIDSVEKAEEKDSQ